MWPTLWLVGRTDSCRTSGHETILARATVSKIQNNNLDERTTRVAAPQCCLHLFLVVLGHRDAKLLPSLTEAPSHPFGP